MEQWEKNYYISAIAGANNGSSLVVMSKGKFDCSVTQFLFNLKHCFRMFSVSICLEGPMW